MAKDDFTKQAEERYKELKKQEDELKSKLDEIKKQKRPLKAYLIEAGVIEKATRKKKAPVTE